MPERKKKFVPSISMGENKDGPIFQSSRKKRRGSGGSHQKRKSFTPATAPFKERFVHSSKKFWERFRYQVKFFFLHCHLDSKDRQAHFKLEHTSCSSTSMFMEHGEDFARQVVENFKVYKIFMILAFRWPYTIEYDKYNSKINAKFNLYSLQTILCCCTTLMNFVMAFGLIVNFIYILEPDLDELLQWGETGFRHKTSLNENQQNLSDAIEWSLIMRHWIVIIPLIIALSHNCLSGIMIFVRHDDVVNFFTLWGKNIRKLKIVIGKSIWRHSIHFYCITLGCFTIMGVISHFGNIPVVKSGPMAVTTVLFRHFQPFMFAPKANGSSKELLYEKTVLPTYLIIGDVFFSYTFFVSKVVIFYFLYSVLLLSKTMQVWMARTHAMIMEQSKHKLTEEECITIWKEYCLLLELLEVTCKLCVGMLEPYFYLTMGYLSLYAYFVIRLFKLENGGFSHQHQRSSISYTEKEKSFSRDNDIYVAFVFFIFESFVWFCVNYSASKIGTVGKLLLKTMRERSFDVKSKKSPHEHALLTSLFYSYGNLNDWNLHLDQILVFGYPTLLSRVDIMISYLVIWYQLNFSFDSLDEQNRHAIGLFLYRWENLPFCHWDYQAMKGIRNKSNPNYAVYKQRCNLTYFVNNSTNSTS